MFLGLRDVVVFGNLLFVNVAVLDKGASRALPKLPPTPPPFADASIITHGDRNLGVPTWIFLACPKNQVDKKAFTIGHVWVKRGYCEFGDW